MRDAVDEVARVAAAREHRRRHRARRHDRARPLARRSSQRARATRWPRRDEYGLDVELLDAAAARDRLAATEVLGATYTPHCAALHPAKLVRGLADAGRAARRATSTSRPRRWTHRARMPSAPTAAPSAPTSSCAPPRATPPQLPGTRRALAPVYSLIIATEPLPDAAWDEIGLRERETFTDLPPPDHLRPAHAPTAGWSFGGRGAPYHFGSRDPAGVRPGAERVFDGAAARRCRAVPRAARRRASPTAGAARSGIARDWHASVGLDPTTGLAWAGGYVGDGVSTTNLAGRTLADLITGRDTALTALPWVGHRSRALGARAAALARRQRRPARDDLGRPRRSAHRTLVAARVAVDAIMRR